MDYPILGAASLGSRVADLALADARRGLHPTVGPMQPAARAARQGERIDHSSRQTSIAGEPISNASADASFVICEGSDMRAFLDAKIIAKALRDALGQRRMVLGHSDALELFARQFCFDNWNMLAAKVDAARAPGDAVRFGQAIRSSGSSSSTTRMNSPSTGAASPSTGSIGFIPARHSTCRIARRFAAASQRTSRRRDARLDLLHADARRRRVSSRVDRKALRLQSSGP